MEWQTIFEAINDAVLILDRDHRVLWANRAAVTLFELNTAAMIGKPCWEITHEVQSPTIEYPSLRMGHTLQREILQFQRGTRWLELTADPILDDRNSLTGAVIITSDITTIKQAEKDLIESEKRYRALFENMAAGFVLFEVIQDKHGIPIDLMIIAANQGFAKTTGLKVKEVQCKRLTHVLPGIENDAADWIGTYGKVALTGEPRHFEQGSELLGYYYSIIAYQAGPKLCGVTFIDISDRKRAEADRDKFQLQLQQAQKLESIGRLAGGVAHDFNNMLSIILGYGQSLIEQLNQEDPLREDLNQIVEAARRSAVLTRQLLAFSRKQTLQPEVLNINEVISNLEKMLRRLIGEDVVLELVLSQEIERVLVDPGQLEQVIMNLAVNARDAMPTGGKLLIETGMTELDRSYTEKHAGVEPGKYILLAMTDNGCGMPDEIKNMIFEPFFTTKEKGKGTGLGLAMVYGIVKQSGGNIWVYSEPDKGTTFKIYFPQTRKEQKTRKYKTTEVVSAGGGECILVVEDEEMLRNLLAKLLKQQRYKVTAVGSGGEALLMIEQNGLKPDLILTDVVMPHMSGKELIARLQENHPNLKALYMSGYTDNAIVTTAFWIRKHLSSKNRSQTNRSWEKSVNFLTVNDCDRKNNCIQTSSNPQRTLRPMRNELRDLQSPPFSCQ